MTEHCCAMMTGNVENTCPQHADRADCPDCLIAYWPTSRAYGIMIHDGGSSMIVIQHCPWCGVKLPERAAMKLEEGEEIQ